MIDESFGETSIPRETHSIDKKDFNGLFGTNGIPVFESPSSQILQQLALEQRVEYFSYRIPGKIKNLIDVGDGELVEIREPAKKPTQPNEVIPLTDDETSAIRESSSLGLGGFLYPSYVTDFLAPHILEQSGRDKVGIRGIAASIDGRITVGEIDIQDIRQIVAQGSERGQDETLITVLDNAHPQFADKTLEWLIQSPQQLRLRLSKDYAGKIFPIVLVYDLDKLSVGNKGLYSVELPQDKMERSKVILKAYVLDYPHK